MSKRRRKFKIEIYEDRGCSSVGTVDIYNMPTKEDIVRTLLNADHAWITDTPEITQCQKETLDRLRKIAADRCDINTVDPFPKELWES